MGDEEIGPRSDHFTKFRLILPERWRKTFTTAGSFEPAVSIGGRRAMAAPPAKPSGLEALAGCGHEPRQRLEVVAALEDCGATRCQACTPAGQLAEAVDGYALVD